MGQRPHLAQRLRARMAPNGSHKSRSPEPGDVHSPPVSPLILAIFRTSLGWIGAIGRGKLLVSLTIGHDSATSVRTTVLRQIDDWDLGTLDAEADWCPDLEQKLVEFAAGKRVRFDDVPLDLPKLTEFQARVLDQTRKIGYGKTLPYGELALRAGFPKAARGVGTVMSKNRFPVIIPCHRVVASQGKLGGYSSPQGVRLKQQLLALEAGRRD